MMNKFMIGQYGSFDERKYRRDFIDGFYGIEACLLQDEDEIARLAAESREAGFRIGIHFQLRGGIHSFRDALFLSGDDAVRTHAFESIEQELAFATALNPAISYFIIQSPSSWTTG